MEEGYLALRWNNHNTIFTKILTLLREQEAYVDVSLACAGRLYAAHKFVLSTCSDYFKEMFNKNPCKHPIVFMKDVSTKDMEALLDFMYKGEVHVPQSDLGSLLRTAEGLQVKGLAVPDDSPRSSSLHPLVPSVPSVARPHPPTLLAPSQLRASKRKRPPESIRKSEDPPKLTLRPDLGPPSLSRPRPRPTGMPELKRIKREEDKSGAGQMEPGEVPRSPSSPTPSAPSPGSHGSDDPAINHTEKIEYMKTEDDADAEEDEGGAGMSGDEEQEEEDDDDDDDDDDEEEEEEGVIGEGDGLSQGVLSYIDTIEQSNSSLPNSDMSTTELLQVDLSEDGTQFIIGPGGLGEVMSRGSSVAGEDERNGERDHHKKPFVCPLCGQSFTRRDNLANHIKTHTGDRPFMCQYCHKCFSRKDYLKQHERIHTGEKPYACDICGRAFTRKEGLTDHMRCHSDFKAFSCETCGKSFKQKCGLRFHKRNYKH